MQYFDDMSRNWVVEGYAAASGFLLGRQTYENLASYWPNAVRGGTGCSPKPLNSLPKYVATTTLPRAARVGELVGPPRATSPRQ